MSLFLGTDLPVMAATASLGAAFVAYAMRLLIGTALAGARARRHVIVLGACATVLSVLLGALLTELGSDRAVLWRNLVRFLPSLAAAAVIGVLVLFPPRRFALRAAAVYIAAFSLIIWAWLPSALVRVAFSAPPAAFLGQGGLNVVTATNVRASARLDFGPDERLGSVASGSEGGLKAVTGPFQGVFLPLERLEGELFLRSTVDGIEAIGTEDVSSAGTARSDTARLRFPRAGEPFSFVSFSDIHENVALYGKLAGNVDFDAMSLAVYLGDFLNHVDSPEQARRSIVGLATGSVALPRAFVRGNHEARGEGARSLASWILPADGEYYYSFTLGDAFFIALDTGEDKPDGSAAYGGLVDFGAYHRRQAIWLAERLASREYRDAKARIVLAHIPPTEEPLAEVEPLWYLLRRRDDIDLVLSGHTHEAAIRLPSDTGLPFPVVCSGGGSADTAAAVAVTVDGGSVSVAIIRPDGSREASSVFGSR
ncbi:MAG: metallophosphoesterase [Spirochaetes bacterium]|nr:metallophosphoesterase [Spirochaetota bacterium]MBU1079096.1 metallophosphoesterase [Spirochaetota bacterium]